MSSLMYPACPAVQAIGDVEIVIKRALRAPRPLVYRVWTEPDHLARWWGPHHFTNPVCEMDLRPGGRYRILMRAPDGQEYPVMGIIREVISNERLVMTDDCAEMPDDWHDEVDPGRDKRLGNPSLESLVTVTFEAQGDDTLLTVHYAFTNTKARDAMMRMGMAEGWTESLERLEICLNTF